MARILFLIYFHYKQNQKQLKFNLLLVSFFLCSLSIFCQEEEEEEEDQKLPPFHMLPKVAGEAKQIYESIVDKDSTGSVRKNLSVIRWRFDQKKKLNDSLTTIAKDSVNSNP